MSDKAIRVTSADNPYDPFEQWEQWLLFDINSGYNTCGRLDKVTHTSDAMTEKELFDAVEDGINILMKTGCINKKGTIVEYKKVIKEIK